jgi:GTP diphosphokinase / guanosine-3',5'-bis(diphosphate) 3'-diphosphatase
MPAGLPPADGATQPVPGSVMVSGRDRESRHWKEETLHLPGLHDDLSTIIKALTFAARKHRDQRRNDHAASPYINHCIALVEVLCNEARIAQADVLCAALLHDTIEDTETTPEELGAAFGAGVAAIVLEVTDDKTLPKLTRKRVQVERAGEASREARLVKLADKICNLRDLAVTPPVGWDLARRQAYFDWALAVVDRMRGTHALLEALFDAAYGNRPQD